MATRKAQRVKRVPAQGEPAPEPSTATTAPPQDAPALAPELVSDTPPHLAPDPADLAPRRSSKADDKVRTTVVLDADEYNALGDFCRHVAKETGRRGVASSEVVRVLVALATADVTGPVARQVVREIDTHGGNRRGRS